MIKDQTIDISQDSCPITFVKTKLALEQMRGGQILEVIGRGDEPRFNVPMAVRDHGHEVLSVEDLDNGGFKLTIRVKN